ncbi:MAG: ATP-dependent DNA helicase [Candidatus Diapherotrites archaeon]|uniref:ATP-dependent DNA helicase n=1 Tax=Candidatus Iainarchaeum sp. TaxID=3101447 RepID=A0A8T4LJ36_9ARCH|nr:ATP-dependent DNA helicase [Candidatus Diapherotrites archaeon]
MELSDIYFRFDQPRPHQDALMLDIGNAIEQGKHILCHAPLGMGKTDAALGPALSYALKHHKTVFFLTPKISQHDIAVQVVNGLAKKFKLNVRAVDLVGKKYMCSDPVLSQAEFDGFYEVCSKRVRREQCAFYANFPGFDKKARDSAKAYLDATLSKYGVVWSHHQLRDYAVNFRLGKDELPLCAYELSVQVARECNVVIADYYHLLAPSIGEVMLKKLAKKLEDAIVIVDEAHNLPERVRKLMSCSLTTFALRKAEEELFKLNQEGLREKLKALEKAVKAIARASLSLERHEALVSKDKLLDPLKGEIDDFEALATELREQGVEYMEATNKSSSYLVQLANFVERWPGNLEGHVRIVKRMNNGEDYSLSMKALDPALVSRGIFDQVHSAVLMSGTLLPLEMYADTLGLPRERTVMKEYKSPFPLENRLHLVVPTVSTKYTSRNFEEYQKIAKEIAKVVNVVPGNSVAFFPSYQVLDSVYPFLAPLVSREIIRQNGRMTSSELSNLLTRFRNAGSAFGAVLLAVAGGSVAEGLDFPGNQLLGAVIVGIPLAEMSLEVQCLIDYFDEKFARGWHYGYLYPAITKAIQASGRVIRSPTDEGIVVFLDKRYTWDNYRNCFPKGFAPIVTEEPEKYIKTFWEKD